VPGLGYHRLHLALRTAEGERGGEQTLIVAPSRCPDPRAQLRGRRAFGLTANLYSVRSARNWGVGDATDLRTLVAFAGAAGAAFVGVNPLHALRNEGGEISPYSPVSRLFRNPLYIDVDAVPELADSAEARAAVAGRAFRRELARLQATTHVDYAAVMRLKSPVLELLHAESARRPSGARRRAYRAYVAAVGDALHRYAVFMAIDEQQRAAGSSTGASGRTSCAPPTRRGSRPSPERTRPGWTTTGGCSSCSTSSSRPPPARRARTGCRWGLYQDLAIGTAPSSGDGWSFPDLFVTGASIGAPPDPLAPQGQNWGLPPLHPLRLAEQGYAYWTALVRGAVRHAGALRIDHVLGLFRQFWIPAGASGRDGAYVRVPTRDLLGVLALETARAGALVVGEDLGTVPPEVPPALEEWRVLSSKVFYFEREAGGGFKPARAYPALSLATANTHDLPTLAGYWLGRDVELRRALGLLPTARAERAARADRARDREALVERLVDEGLLDAEAPPPDDVTLRAAVHAFLRRTPAWLVGLSLEDLVGEVEPVNVPGVGPRRLPELDAPPLRAARCARHRRRRAPRARRRARLGQVARREPRGTPPRGTDPCPSPATCPPPPTASSSAPSSRSTTPARSSRTSRASASGSSTPPRSSRRDRGARTGTTSSTRAP
jgi:4-alpha-glucanotransferase